MNDEDTNKEKRIEGLTSSIVRMTERLEKIRSFASSALDRALSARAENHMGEAWRILSKGLGDIRHELGPCGIMMDACWERACDALRHKPAGGEIPAPPPYDPAVGTGEFFTPKEAIDVVLANPPMGEVGEDRKWYQIFDIPELDIFWLRFYSDSFVLYVAPWHDHASSHVYTVTMARSKTNPEEYSADAWCDGHLLFTLGTRSRYLCERLVLAAFRQRLIRTHRRTWSKRRAVKPQELQDAGEV